jgi:hypothetical protein
MMSAGVRGAIAAVVVAGVGGFLWLSQTRVEPGEPALRSSLQPLTTEPQPELTAQPVMRTSPAPAHAPSPTPASAEPTDDMPVAPAKPHGHSMELENIPPPGAMGPVRARKERFASESQAASSHARELKLRAAIEDTAPPGLLEDVLCRRTICRVRMDWKAERAIALLSVLSELRGRFDAELGVDEPSALDAAGTRRVEVYLELADSAP